MASEAHSVFSPSGAHRWVECPASIQAINYLRNKGDIAQDESSPHALEGTRAHEVAAEALASKKRVDTDDFKGADLEAIEDYVEYVRWLEKEESGTLFVEQRVHIPKVHDSCFGTVDAAIVSDDRLHVIDLKFGRGVPVNAVENEQMMMYASGVLCDDLIYPEMPSDKMEVVLHIFMPRIPDSRYPHHYRRIWSTTVGVIKRFSKAANKAAHDANGLIEYGGMPSDGYSPSDKVCKWCPIEALCERRRASLLDDFEDLEGPVDLVMPEQLQDIFLKRKAIVKYLGKVEAYISSQFGEDDTHNDYPQLMMGEGRSTPAWADQEHVVAAFESKGLDPYEKKLKGITIARKQLKDKELIDSLIEYGPAKRQLMEK